MDNKIEGALLVYVADRAHACPEAKALIARLERLGATVVIGQPESVVEFVIPKLTEHRLEHIDTVEKYSPDQHYLKLRKRYR